MSQSQNSTKKGGGEVKQGINPVLRRVVSFSHPQPLTHRLSRVYDDLGVLLFSCLAAWVLLC